MLKHQDQALFTKVYYKFEIKINLILAQLQSLPYYVIY